MVKGITDGIIRTHLMQVNIRSDLANGNVVVGVHNNIPPHSDLLLGNVLSNPNSALCLKNEIIVVTRPQSRVFKQNTNVEQKMTLI